MKRYSGIQPQYFPRLHYFARILNADVFSLRDDCQFVRQHKYPDGKNGKSYQAHTPIKQSSGQLLLGVTTAHEGLQPIAATHLADQTWVKDHLKAIQLNYGKSLNFQALIPEIELILNQKYSNLADLNLTTTLWGIIKLLSNERIHPEDLNIRGVENALKDSDVFRLRSIRRASESKQLKEGMTANQKIIALCQEYGCSEDYCGGTGVAAYIDHDIFKSSGITINVQDWICQEYLQQFTKQIGFLPNLSIVDLLMNVPREEAVKIIKG